MAHELTKIAGKVSMAFTGSTPWHGLGQRLTETATIEQWTNEAGMNWDALAAPVQFTRADGSIANMGSKQVIYRGDTGTPLSVMGDGYKIVQPRQCLQFFESLIEGGDYRLHTAGVLNGGRRMWALARNGASAEVVKGDKVARFLLMATSLDGSTPTVAKFTSVRVVCANTIAIALREKESAGSAVRVSHRSIFDEWEVKRALGLADASWSAYVDSMRELSEKRITLGDARDLLRDIFGQPVDSRRKNAEAPAPAPAEAINLTPQAAGVDFAALLQGAHVPRESVSPEQDARDDLARILAGGSQREQKSVARILALYAGEGRGSMAEGVAGTAWGLLNAATEHIDHELGRTRDAGLSSAWFGKGDAAKNDVLAALLAR